MTDWDTNTMDTKGFGGNCCQWDSSNQNTPFVRGSSRGRIGVRGRGRGRGNVSTNQSSPKIQQEAWSIENFESQTPAEMQPPTESNTWGDEAPVPTQSWNGNGHSAQNNTGNVPSRDCGQWEPNCGWVVRDNGRGRWGGRGRAVACEGASNDSWGGNNDSWGGNNTTDNSGGWSNAPGSSDSYSSRGRGGGGRGGGSRACFKCGEEGHMSRECPSGGGGGGGSRACFKCGEEGHMSRECPTGGGGGGGGGSRACFKCGEEGHMSRECPTGGGGGGGRPRTCHKCGAEGHMSRECPDAGGQSSGGGGWGGTTNGTSNGGWGGDSKTDVANGDCGWGGANHRSDGGGRGRGRGGRGGGRGCFKCGEEGHMSRECPTGGGGGGGGSRACFKCGEEGHMSRECPTGGGGGGGGGSGKCYKCGEEGHMSRECPTGGGDKERQSGCHNCGQDGHFSRECTEPKKPRLGEDGEEVPAAMTYVPEYREVEDLFSDGVDAGIHFTQQQNIPVKVTGGGAHPTPIKAFAQANLRSLIMENVTKARYTVPTPIQQYAIPIIMAGRDMMACAQTGSGKTAGFLLPILHYVMANESECTTYGSCEPVTLIVSPTRELAIQIYDEARKFCNGSGIKVQVIYGGTAVFNQRKNLQNGCHILVATPGRLADFIEKRYVILSQIKFLVLDEADRMLDMGFLSSMQKIVNNEDYPKSGRQTLMFSATFPQEIQNLAKDFLSDYLFVTVGMVGAANSDVKQIILNISKNEKRDSLISFINEKVAENRAVKILVFVDKKRTADFLAAFLSGNDVNSTSIHGDRLQSQREQALLDFKRGSRNVLVATAVAARGLDIKCVGYVLNYDLPKEIDEYVHRIGRTGRVGNLGHAISYFDAETDIPLSKDLIKVLADAEQEIPDFLREAGSGMGSTLSYEGNYMASDIRSKHRGPASSYEHSQPQQMESVAEESEVW